MIADEPGMHLHDRFTRGEALGDEERAQLEAWYEAQDRAEAEELGLNGPLESVAALQEEVDAALKHIAAITTRIQELDAENHALRREIALLHGRLAQQAASHAA